MFRILGGSQEGYQTWGLYRLCTSKATVLACGGGPQNRHLSPRLLAREPKENNLSLPRLTFSSAKYGPTHNVILSRFTSMLIES